MLESVFFTVENKSCLSHNNLAVSIFYQYPPESFGNR